MRRALTLLPLVGLLVATASAHAAPDSAPRDPKAPRQRHTAADTRLARSLVLRRSDLAAGWTLDKAAKPGPACSAGPDESHLVQTAKADPSFTYRDGVTSVGSEVDIFRRASEARLDWRLSTLALLKTCLLQSARAGFGKRAHVAIASAERLAPVPGVERSLHFRLAFVVRSQQRTVRLVTDIVALGRSRISVVLHTLTVAQPLPAAVLESLTRTLADRLEGGRLGA